MQTAEIIYLDDEKVIDTTTIDQPDKEATARIYVFAYLLSHLFLYIDRECSGGGLRMKVYIQDQFMRLGSSKTWRDNLQGFLWRQEPLCAQSFKDVLDNNCMHNLLHKIYQRMCEMVGPVKADICLSQAVIEAQNIPEAKQFDPQSLL